MNSSDIYNIGGLDDGSGEPLNINKTRPPSTKRHYTQHNSANIMAKIFGIISLLASIALFVTAATLNTWLYAAIGGGLCILAIGCMIASSIIDYNKTQEPPPPAITVPYAANARDLPTLPPINTQAPAAGINNIRSKYNTRDYYPNPLAQQMIDK